VCILHSLGIIGEMCSVAMFVFVALQTLFHTRVVQMFIIFIQNFIFLNREMH
jgi:hypothetical protein